MPAPSMMRRHATLSRAVSPDTHGLEGASQSQPGAALAYVEETFGRDLAHVTPPRAYRATEYMMVDEVTRRHLELISSSRWRAARLAAFRSR